MSEEQKKNNDGKPGQNLPKNYEVTAQGSLGLLALGAVGIKAWRKKREEERNKLKAKTDNE